MTAARPLTPDEAEDLAAARLRALHAMPYLASALFEVVLLAAPGLGTFAIDPGWRLYVDPDRLRHWGPIEAGAVLIHEVCHLLRDHHARATERDLAGTFVWNLAADAEINDDLLAADVPLPDGPITPQVLGSEDGLTAEEYLADLLRDDEQHGAGGRATAECGSGAGGARHDCEVADDDVRAPARTPTEVELTRRAVAQASLDHARRTPGSVPAGLERWADGLLRPPTVPWQRLLAVTIRRGIGQQAGRLDYRYDRPGRRRIPRVVTPSMTAPKPRVVTVVDTSASMDSDALDAARSEIEGICRRAGLRGDHHRVVTADTAVHDVGRIGTARRLRLRGGGGTDLRPAIDHALGLRPVPDLLVVLTDGWTPWPDTPPHLPVVIGLVRHADESAPPTPDWATVVPVPAGQAHR